MANLGGGLRTVDWSSTKLEHFEKNFYIEDKRVTTRSERETEEFRRLKEIKVLRLPLSFLLQFLPQLIGSRS
jgi:ATP-dependent RNA helicase DDX5/DBP2